MSRFPLRRVGDNPGSVLVRAHSASRSAPASARIRFALVDVSPQAVWGLVPWLWCPVTRSTPAANAFRDILDDHLRHVPLTDRLGDYAATTDGVSGADISLVVREAGRTSLRHVAFADVSRSRTKT